jgi:hypothetical protein
VSGARDACVGRSTSTRLACHRSLRNIQVAGDFRPRGARSLPPPIPSQLKRAASRASLLHLGDEFASIPQNHRKAGAGRHRAPQRRSPICMLISNACRPGFSTLCDQPLEVGLLLQHLYSDETCSGLPLRNRLASQNTSPPQRSFCNWAALLDLVPRRRRCGPHRRLNRRLR